MTIVTSAFNTYGAIGNREDLTNAIWNISPAETPFVNMIAKSKARAVQHEWQTDSFRAAATNAQLEGDTVAGSTSTATVRLKNTCQIVSVDIVVTGTQEVVEKAGRNSEMAYQLAKKGKELKRDIEYNVTQNQTGVQTGATGTARKMRGLENWIRTNSQRNTTSSSTKGKAATGNGVTMAAVDASGQRAFSETLLKKLLATMYTNGADPSIVMVGPHNKQTFSTFTGRSNSREMIDRNTVQGAADMYASDYGDLKVIPNRFNRDRSVIVFDPEYASIAWLRPLFTYDLARVGDALRKDMRGELTLEMRNEAAFGIIGDVKTSS